MGGATALTPEVGYFFRKKHLEVSVKVKLLFFLKKQVVACFVLNLKKRRYWKHYPAAVNVHMKSNSENK